MAELDYDKTFEPHDRGSILVFAVYEAFLAIVARRTEDLIQLATGGTGVLPAGACIPGWSSASPTRPPRPPQQMLTMCIRALDYCPAVDITFGEYLRALITADIDAFPTTRGTTALAFMESFRKWKLLPRDVRTVSEETLAWSTLDDPSPDWLHGLLGKIDLELEPETQPLRDLCAQREEPLGAVERDEARLRRQPRSLRAVRPAARSAALQRATARCSARRARARRPSTSSACARPAASSLTARSAPRSSPPSTSACPCGPTARIARDGVKRRRGLLLVPRRRHRHHRSAQGAARKSATRSSRIPAAPSGRSARRRPRPRTTCRRSGRSISAARLREPFALLHADQGGDSDG